MACRTRVRCVRRLGRIRSPVSQRRRRCVDDARRPVRGGPQRGRSSPYAIPPFLRRRIHLPPTPRRLGPRRRHLRSLPGDVLRSALHGRARVGPDLARPERERRRGTTRGTRCRMPWSNASRRSMNASQIAFERGARASICCAASAAIPVGSNRRVVTQPSAARPVACGSRDEHRPLSRLAGRRRPAPRSTNPTSQPCPTSRGAVLQPQPELLPPASEGTVPSSLASPVRHGTWWVGATVDAYRLPEYLTAPLPSYLSLQTALHLRGMVEQIPEVLYWRARRSRRPLRRRSPRRSVRPPPRSSPPRSPRRPLEDRMSRRCKRRPPRTSSRSAAAPRLAPSDDVPEQARSGRSTSIATPSSSEASSSRAGRPSSFRRRSPSARRRCPGGTRSPPPRRRKRRRRSRRPRPCKPDSRWSIRRTRDRSRRRLRRRPMRSSR